MLWWCHVLNDVTYCSHSPYVSFPSRWGKMLIYVHNGIEGSRPYVTSIKCSCSRVFMHVRWQVYFDKHIIISILWWAYYNHITPGLVGRAVTAKAGSLYTMASWHGQTPLVGGMRWYPGCGRPGCRLMIITPIRYGGGAYIFMHIWYDNDYE